MKELKHLPEINDLEFTSMTNESYHRLIRLAAIALSKVPAEKIIGDLIDNLRQCINSGDPMNNAVFTANNWVIEREFNHELSALAVDLYALDNATV
jgi:hypothetical protein